MIRFFNIRYSLCQTNRHFASESERFGSDEGFFGGVLPSGICEAGSLQGGYTSPKINHYNGETQPFEDILYIYIYIYY